MEKALVLDLKDNVATAIAELKLRDKVSVLVGSERLEIEINDPIRFGHKFAIKPIPKGDEVIKYGESIGRSTVSIEKGRHVHTHNVEIMRGRGDLA